MTRFLMPTTTLTTLNLKKTAFTLLCCTVLMLAAAPVWADQCSAPTLGPGTGIVGTASGTDTCGALITVATVDGNGAATSFIVTIPNGGNGNPYDGLEDSLIGIQNNSGANLFSITLSSSSFPIFSFDGDGPCSINEADCFGNTGYEGPHNTFTPANPNSGTVNFFNSPNESNLGIPPGGSTWFALEGTPQSVTTVSQTKTLGPPGTTTTFTFNTDSWKVTGVNNSGGEVLTVEAVLVPKSLFPILTKFPHETCVPYGDYSAALGQDTCVEFHMECANQPDCTTGFTYLVATGYDLPASLSLGIGGPDFLVRHGGSCPLFPTDNDNVESIFLSYTADVKDPTTRGGSGTPSCFVATYNTLASPITSGTFSAFEGFELFVSNTQINPVFQGLPVILVWDLNTNLGVPVPNLHLCNNTSGTNCTAPWVNLRLIKVPNSTCPTGFPPTGPLPSFFNLGLRRGDEVGEWVFVWDTKAPKNLKSCQVSVVLTFDTGLVVAPAKFQYKF